jgi:hypothetical protein
MNRKEIMFVYYSTLFTLRDTISIIIIILYVFNEFIIIHIINFPVKNDSMSLPTVIKGHKYETFRRKNTTAVYNDTPCRNS